MLSDSTGSLFGYAGWNSRINSIKEKGTSLRLSHIQS